MENYGLSKRRGVRCPPFEKLLIENVCVGRTFIRLEGIGRLEIDFGRFMPLFYISADTTPGPSEVSSTSTQKAWKTQRDFPDVCDELAGCYDSTSGRQTPS